MNSSSSVNAALALGHVLAMRALESGITQVFVCDEYKSDKSSKVCFVVKLEFFY